METANKETQFINGRFLSHMNLGNTGIRLDVFEISNAGHYLNGKKVCREVVTPKKRGVWGKGKANFYLQEEKNSPLFESIADFKTHYGL